MKLVLSLEEDSFASFQKILEGLGISGVLYIPDGNREYRYAVNCEEDDLLMMKLQVPLKIVSEENLTKFHKLYLNRV